MTHTPGPWTIEEVNNTRMVCGRSPFGKSLPNASGDMVLACPAPYGAEHEQERESNLRLITAAPDLLEALESLCAVIGKMKPATGEPYGRAVAELIEARATIAKARGQS